MPKSISRIFGKDKFEILYIGENEKNLLERVKSLKIAILSNCKAGQKKPKEVGHKTLSKKYYRIRKHIDESELYVLIYPIKISNKVDESILIEKYIQSYGETPSLNGNYGSHANWEHYH